MTTDIASARQQFEALRALDLKLNMTRGQPCPEQFDLSNDMLTIVGPDNVTTADGVAIRNYGGGAAGLKEARELFGEMLGVSAAQTIVRNNASLELMYSVLAWGRLHGLRGSEAPWPEGSKFIVTVPGYDRHFGLLEQLGYEMVPVSIGEDGPDMDQVEALGRSGEYVKLWWLPHTAKAALFRADHTTDSGAGARSLPTRTPRGT